jgi:hypothetical protein
MDPDDAEQRFADEPMHVAAPGITDDTRTATSIPGLAIRRGPSLHPDDVTTHNGTPVTSPSPHPDRLRRGHDRRRAQGRLRSRAGDRPARRRRASGSTRARVEWRPSLEMLDEVIAEFC